MKVREVMNSQVETVRPQMTVREAAALMRDQGIGDVIVAEGDTLLGVATDRDIVVRAVADGKDTGTEPVESVCSSRLTVIGPDADLEEAARVMREGSVRRLPVVENDRLTGIVAIGDLAIEQDPGSALADISAARTNE
ncbi:CBS domain-containing protein [Spinactinospora alkalitolerans]|uniref:CBS domain-containing protein n=1 Tax=Spinactinospora alkalitolerans TaxID=687207 RepID=A0A852U262_9ACTN|nr:CBS domain-containing protein [Spinactinospora alkalitolerans]NYE48234.1 CBS domain-containing protein [Spinactinospora alkalitolerans]